MKIDFNINIMIAIEKHNRRLTERTVVKHITYGSGLPILSGAPKPLQNPNLKHPFQKRESISAFMHAFRPIK